MSQEPVPFSSGTKNPDLKAPPNACDCHHHIFDMAVPSAPGREPRADATVEQYQLLQKRIGTSRNVIVTASNYGANNEGTLAALVQFGKSARAVAVVDENVTDFELKRLDAKGVRGIRFTRPPTIDTFRKLSKRVADIGWHVQVNIMEKGYIVVMHKLLEELPSMLVFDHMARIRALSDPALDVMRRLLEKGKTWVKLSGPYVISQVGPPDYNDAVDIAKVFVRTAPERMVWGSDWPHPSATVKPNDAQVFDLNLQWAPDAKIRELILVRNPESLYGF